MEKNLQKHLTLTIFLEISCTFSYKSIEMFAILQEKKIAAFNTLYLYTLGYLIIKQYPGK